VTGGYCLCGGATPPAPAKILFTSQHTAPAFPTPGYDKDCDYETFEMNDTGTGVVQVTNACTNYYANAIQASYNVDRTCVAYTTVVQSTYGPNVESIYVTNAPGKTCSIPSGYKAGGYYSCGGFDGYCYNDYYRHPVFSKDGTKIFYERNSVTGFPNGFVERTGYQIVEMNASTGVATAVLTSGSDAIYPMVSPDGTKILYTSTASGYSEIWIMNINGTGKTQLTDSSGTAQFYQKGNFYGSFSANGSKIAFLTNRDKTASNDFSDVYIMNVNGSSQTVVANYNRYKVGVAFYGYGNKIAIFEQNTVYTINADGTGLTQLSPGIAATSYSAYGNASGSNSYR
jgi:Tol biopolymer transport system component